jgi:CRP-like cAMP-binding protein
MENIDDLTFDPRSFLDRVGDGKSMVKFRERQSVFAQGDPADSVFFLQRGRVELRVVSQQGKRAVLGILTADSFFGEGCLAGQPVRMATAIATTASTVIRIQKAAMIQVLHDDPAFAARFVSYLLSRNIRIEEDLIDQLFNSSEKRLARVLLLLANFGSEGAPEAVIPKINQETLAAMVGTTRSRVSFFMNKFRKQGFIDYNGHLEIRSSLLNVVLHD